MDDPVGLFDGIGQTVEERMAVVVTTMRELSQQTDPLEMGRLYAKRMRKILPVDRSVSISRRHLHQPFFRVTRSTTWQTQPNPWKQLDELPVYQGGLCSELLYGNEPRLFEDFAIDPSDPAVEYLEGHRSLLAIPMFDQGVTMNMILLMRKEPAAFEPRQFPELVWMSNLFGRITHNLVLSDRLKEAFDAVDYEMKVVADIQRSLLPSQMPAIPTMAVAAHYQTSHRAGGDYYDFFPLADGKWGLFIADVSGHGTPAAVLMAVTHSLAHSYCGPGDPPGKLLEYVNHHLSMRYTFHSDTFVTAFYGIYDPAQRSLVYACAGHNPPRLKRCVDGSLLQLDGVRGLPLGINLLEKYATATYRLVPGDQLVLYTDGITEAHNAAGEMYGLARLDKVLENCSVTASDLLKSVLESVEEFTEGKPALDDRTLLVAKIS